MKSWISHRKQAVCVQLADHGAGNDVPSTEGVLGDEKSDGQRRERCTSQVRLKREGDETCEESGGSPSKACVFGSEEVVEHADCDDSVTKHLSRKDNLSITFSNVIRDPGALVVHTYDHRFERLNLHFCLHEYKSATRDGNRLTC